MTDRYPELVARVDAFWERATRLQPAAFACRIGCVGCCLPGLSIFPVEADRISEHLKTLDPTERRRLARQIDREDHCPLLLGDRCAIYPARPILCRTHGLALRVEGAIDHCPLNYQGVTPLPGAVLDLEQLNTVLVLTDRLYRDTAGISPDVPRVLLSEIVRAAAASGPPG